MLRTALALVLLAACDRPVAPPAPQTEVVFEDAHARVTLTTIDQGGFPDAVSDYDVAIEQGGARRSVLRGRAEIQHAAHQVRAHRLDSLVAIALGDALCLVDASGTPSCFDLSEVGPETHAIGPFADAIAWRASDAVGDERAVAAIALAWVDPARGIAAVHACDGVSDARRAELDATLARLTEER